MGHEKDCDGSVFIAVYSILYRIVYIAIFTNQCSTDFGRKTASDLCLITIFLCDTPFFEDCHACNSAKNLTIAASVSSSRVFLLLKFKPIAMLRYLEYYSFLHQRDTTL